VPVSKEQIKDAPNIETEGDELSQTDEAALYHHYSSTTPNPTPRPVVGLPAAEATPDGRQPAPHGRTLSTTLSGRVSPRG
jgi:hypothetical protein